ncbi:MAG: hypothetical protein A2Y23_13185 [Clostridiales bacterium GWB2_37_7]|nr:MAG: hypothetical protein A2Y23_13185 [Clostridiales bacterium GWB2_37_7]
MARITKNPFNLIIFAVGFIFGTILTLAITTVFLSYRIDKFHQQIEGLQNSLAERSIQLQKLNESLDKRKFILRDIEIIIDSPMDEADANLIQTSIKEKLNTLIGKEVKTIDTELISEIIDKRILITAIMQYKLKLKRLILSDSLRIWVEADILDGIN